MTDTDRLDAPSEEWQRGFEAAVATRGPAMTTWRGICGHLWDRSIEDTDDCPRCAAVRERDVLREAALAVVGPRPRRREWKSITRLRDALDRGAGAGFEHPRLGVMALSDGGSELRAGGGRE